MTVERILEKHRQDFPFVEGEDSEHRARYYFLRGWLPEVFADIDKNNMEHPAALKIETNPLYNTEDSIVYVDGRPIGQLVDGLVVPLITPPIPPTPPTKMGICFFDGMLYFDGCLIGKVLSGTVVDGLPFIVRRINGTIEQAQWIKDAFAEQPV